MNGDVLHIQLAVRITGAISVDAVLGVFVAYDSDVFDGHIVGGGHNAQNVVIFGRVPVSNGDDLIILTIQRHTSRQSHSGLIGCQTSHLGYSDVTL